MPWCEQIAAPLGTQRAIEQNDRVLATTRAWRLSPSELRVLGCLLEKQRTTPDGYPLSLNSLRLACNQSTNRDPVVDYDDALIRSALHGLERRGLVRLASGAGSRAAKYRHLLAQALPMNASEQAILCVLMLRGPQTPGELKQRSERMHAFVDLSGVHDALGVLIERGLAARLERRPGQKEERYAQLLQAEDEDRQAGPGHAEAAVAVPPPLERELPEADSAAGFPVAALRDLDQRISALEREVAELRAASSPSEDDREPRA